MDLGRPRSADLRFGFALLLLFVGGAALAAYRLGAQSLWLDETYTWWFTRLGWGDLLQAARIDAVNPPLYYLYVKLLAQSASEAALRMPSVIAQIAGIAGAACLGFLLGARPGAIAAGLVWAAHPMAVWASRDARPYALAAALAVVTVALFVRLQRTWSRSSAVLTGVLIALGLLTHYFFFVLLAVLLVLAALDLRRSPIFFRRWTTVALLAMVPLALWLVWFFSTGSPSLGIGWIRPPVLSDIPLTLWNLASGFGGVAEPASTLLGLAVLAIAGFALAGATRPLALRLAIAGLVLPVLGVWLISQRRPVYVDRYFVVMLPFVVALVALGAASIMRKVGDTPRSQAAWGLSAVGACLILGLAGSTVHTSPKFAKEDWRGLADFLQDQGVGVEEMLLSEPEIALPLSYYYDEGLVEEASRFLTRCQGTCWWISRQPYTATHAFTQSVGETGRHSPADRIPSCPQRTEWTSPTGVAGRELECGG